MQATCVRVHMHTHWGGSLGHSPGPPGLQQCQQHLDPAHEDGRAPLPLQHVAQELFDGLLPGAGAGAGSGVAVAAWVAASAACLLACCFSSMNTPAHTPRVARKAQRKRRMLRFIIAEKKSDELCGVDGDGAFRHLGCRWLQLDFHLQRLFLLCQLLQL